MQVHRAQGALSAAARASAAYNSAMAYAEPGSAEHKARLRRGCLHGLAGQGALRREQLLQRGGRHSGPTYAQSEQGCLGCLLWVQAGAAAPAPLDHADMAECLEELTRRFRACAAAGLPGGDAWQYAEAGRAEHKAGAGEAAEAMLSTADLAERLRELIAA